MSEYDALLDPPKSEYDALLDESPNYDSLLEPSPQVAIPEHVGPSALMHRLLEKSNTPLLPHVAAPQQEGLPMQIVAGINNAAGNVAESLSTPQNLALLPLTATKTLGRVVAGLFGGKMAYDIPEQVRQAEAQPTVQGRLEGGLGVITSLLFAGGAAKHAIGKPKLTEAVNRIYGETPPVAEPVSSVPQAVTDSVSTPKAEALTTALPDEIQTTDSRTATTTPEISPAEGRKGLDQKNGELEAAGLAPDESGQVRAGVDAAAPEAVVAEPEIISSGTVEGQPGVVPTEAVPAKPLTEIMSPGPGAASAQEPLASYEQRRFGKRFQEDEKIAPEIREETGNRYYEPISNKITVAEAESLIEERGTDHSIRLVRDENAPMEPRVRATMAQGLIKKLNQSYNEAKAAGDTNSAKTFLDQSVETAEHLSFLGTQLGQGVQAFAIWSRLTPEGTLLSVRRSVERAQEKVKKIDPDRPTDKLPNLTPEAEAKILDLAQKVQEAPEGMPKDEATKTLNKFIAKQEGFDVIDLPLGVYYGNILSGYNTHIVNSLDTFLNVVSEVNGLAMSNPRAAAIVYAGMIRGIGEGKLDATLAITKGRMATDGKWLDSPRLMEVAEFGKKGGVPIREEGVVSSTVKRLAESKIATPLNAYKYVTRLLAASDAVMFRGAKEARASLLAHRIAEGEGLKGDALLARQREVLGSAQIEDFMAQAKREGFSGTQAKVRAAELRDMVRPDELSSDAADFAGEATYNHEPHGMLGYLSGKISETSQKYPALKLFVPFTRIVANVTNRGLNWTPFGFKRAVKGYSGGEPLTAEARRLMLTRATVGTAGLVTLGAMQAGGLLKIHGAGPSDKERRKQQQAAGWRPYSLQIGDKYFSYVYTPIGLGLSVVGNMSDAERYGELDQKDAATRGAYALSRVGSTVFSQSFLSGLSRLFSALSSSPSEAISAVKQTMSSTTAALTTPNLFRDVQRLFDPKAYKSNTLMEDMVRNTPFAALVLKPEINAFGEPVKLQRQRFVGKMTSDREWKTVIELGLRVPVPSKSTEIKKGEQITPNQYYDLLKSTGPTIKSWIRDNESTLRGLTPEEAQDKLTVEATKIRKSALQKLR